MNKVAKLHLSRVVPKVVSPGKLYDLHFQSKRRIDIHIKKTLGTGHVNEYLLMEEFESKKVFPYIVAVEYEIDDGIRLNHSGDLLCYDGDKTLITLELKCIKNHENQTERLKKVKDQAYKLSKRLSSWVSHVSNIDQSLGDLKKLEIIPAFYVDSDVNNVYYL